MAGTKAMDFYYLNADYFLVESVAENYVVELDGAANGGEVVPSVEMHEEMVSWVVEKQHVHRMLKPVGVLIIAPKANVEIDVENYGESFWVNSNGDLEDDYED